MIYTMGLLGIIVGLVVIRDCSSLHKEITSITWNTNKLDLNYEQEPKVETRIIALGVLLNLALVLLASALHWHSAFENGDLFYAVLLFNRLENPVLSNVLCNLYSYTIPLMGYAMVHNSFLLTYLILKVKDRFNLLDNILEDLCTNHDGVDDDVLMEDANYQNKIFELLKVCICQHSFLKRFQRKMNDTLSKPLVSISTLGVCFIISVFFTFFNVEPESQDVLLTSHFWLISVTLSGSVMNLMLAFYSGQMIINLSEDVYNNALNSSWTGWNLKNRKILLIFLSNLQEPVFVGVRGRIVSAITSACTFFYGFQ